MKRFSKIKPIIKKRLLIKGTILSFIGITLLIGMGTFAPVSMLSSWGIPTFFIGIFLIGGGLIPYRKLTRLETCPHQLLLNNNSLTFISTRGNHVVVPYEAVEKVSYIETRNRYGIRLELKEGDPLFFPYFLDDSCLNEIVHPNQPNEPL